MVTRVPISAAPRRRVEAYLGDSAYGPRYGSRIESVPTLVSALRKQVADKKAGRPSPRPK